MPAALAAWTRISRNKIESRRVGYPSPGILGDGYVRICFVLGGEKRAILCGADANAAAAAEDSDNAIARVC